VDRLPVGIDRRKARLYYPRIVTVDWHPSPHEGKTPALPDATFAAPTSMAHVLIVDDNIPLAENLVEILADGGHEVSVAAGGREALALARQHHFELAVLDVAMPQMDGVTLAGLLETASPGTTVVFMSGYSNTAQHRAAEQISGRPILDKPLDILELLDLVDNAA